MPKLHELLAIEGSLATQAETTRRDLAATFEKKRHLFEEKRVTFLPSGENAVAKTESQSDIQSTVLKELDWLSGFLTKFIDASHQVNVANTSAKADLVLEDGTILAKDLPATTLLELEKRAKELHELVAAIPTLDPAKGFSPDTDKGIGIFKAREVNKTRTQKQQKVVVLYPATDKHPAQTQLIPEDVPIGTIQEQEWSGLITPAEKAAMLDRVEQLTRAARKARSRANDLETPKDDAKIAGRLLSFVFKGAAA